MALLEIFKSLRPQQWIKNFFIFAPLVFSLNMFNRPMLLRTIAAFAAFCILSSAHYIFNDLMDIEEDRLHPLKSKRPIAAGRLKKAPAVLAMGVMGVLGIIFAAAVNLPFLLISVGYLFLQVLYTLRLKHIVILDVFVVAAGFVMRVIAGGLAIRVTISSWLLICAMLLALFLAMGKRRHELVLLESKATNHRPILKEYNTYLLDQMISVVTASTLVAYCLTSVDGQAYTWDANGNLLNDGSKSYAYDQANRLTNISANGLRQTNPRRPVVLKTKRQLAQARSNQKL